MAHVQNLQYITLKINHLKLLFL